MSPTSLSHVVSPNETDQYGHEPISSSLTFLDLGDSSLGETTTLMPNLVMSIVEGALVAIVPV